MPVPLLVGLAASDRDAQSLGRFLDVVGVQSNQLRPAERAGKANEQQGAVASGRQPRPRERRHPYHALAGGRHLLAGCSTEGASDTADRRSHTFVVGRQGQAGQLVRITDRRNPAADGGRPDLALGFMGQKGGHGLGRGRQRAYAAPGAPGAENLEVGTVGPPRGRSLLSARVFRSGRYLPGGEWQGLTSGQPSAATSRRPEIRSETLMAKLSPVASSSPRRLISSLRALHSVSAPLSTASAWPSASASCAFERLWKRDVVGRSVAWAWNHPPGLG